MARSGEEGKVHPGADDNASGTAVVMELAAYFATQLGWNGKSVTAPSSTPPLTKNGTGVLELTKSRRGLIFALWSGEEMGLIGSAAFGEKPPVPMEKIAAYVNSVGRLRDDKLTLQGIGSKLWRKLSRNATSPPASTSSSRRPVSADRRRASIPSASLS
jgi:hypothetical protein